MYTRAVVPLDGSAVAEAILPFTLQIAGPLDMEVVLLRVVTPSQPVIVEVASYVPAEADDAMRLDAEEYLAALAAELASKGVRVHVCLRRGLASDEILA